MPSAYAHLRFGREVLSALPPKYRAAAKAMNQLYTVGLQGPDPLFFYNPLASNSVAHQGHALHAQSGAAFFEEALKRYRQAPSDGGLAYLFGVLAHYCLDKTCHPMINTVTEAENLDHMELETEFDRFLLQQDGLLPPHRQPVYKYLTLTRGERATAAALYPDLRPGAFGWCLRNMSNVYRLAASRNRKFSRAILGLGGKKGRAFLMTAGPNPQYAHLDAPILALYEEAAAAFPAMAQALAAAIENETPFGEEFTPAFG